MMKNCNKQPLKFSLELNEQGIMTVEMQGSGMDIGKNLFLPFFTNMDFYGKAVAAGISAAMRMAYPVGTDKLLKVKNKKQMNDGTPH